MKIIDENLLNEVSARAKESPRLRMNYNFHRSLDEKCHRLAIAFLCLDSAMLKQAWHCSHCSIGF